MAHPNIEERRAYVKEQMEKGDFPGKKQRRVAKKFGCSPSAIRADIIAINYGHCSTTYHVSVAMRKYIIERDNGICYLCNKYTDDPIVEHLIPAAQGGLATPDNLAVACQFCNIKKARVDNPPELWGKTIINKDKLGKSFRAVTRIILPKNIDNQNNIFPPADLIETIRKKVKNCNR